MADEQARLIIRGENQTEAAFRQVKRSLGDVDGATAKLNSTLAKIGLGTSLALLVRQVGQAVLEAEQSEARLAATLRATGFAAGFTTGELEKMNAQLVEVSQFDDESIRNAQAQLVKFGNISGDVFKHALTLSADYASLLGTDIPDAAQQLGRALAAPAVGLTFLERNVGKFSDATHNAINEMIALGRTSDAQVLILNELDRRIAGTAKTMNSGLTKATHDLSKEWNNLLEAFGRTNAVQKPTESFLGFLTQSMKDLEELMTHGDWVEKTLGLLAFAGGWRGLKLTPGPTPPLKPGEKTPDEARAAAEDAQNQALFEAYLRKQKEEQQKRFAQYEKEAEDDRKKALEDEAKLQDANTKGWIASADAIMQAADEENTALAAVNDQLWSQADRLQGLVQPLRDINRERELATQLRKKGILSEEDYAATQARLDEEARAALGDTGDSIKEATSAAHEFSLVMNSAASDAIRNWQGFDNLLQSIIKDFAQIEFKKYVLDPLTKSADSVLGNVFGNLFGGGKAGASSAADLQLTSLAGPGFATGGSFTVGGGGGTDSQLVRFMATPGEEVSVRRPGQSDGGGVVIHQVNHFAVGIRGEVRAELQAQLPAIARASVAAVSDANRRGQRVVG